MRLPITVPNPARAQFIARESTDARDETCALVTVAPKKGAIMAVEMGPVFGLSYGHFDPLVGPVTTLFS
jgi:hypothetical protein